MFDNSIRAWAVLGTVGWLTAVSGCAHEVESPKVTLDTLEPNLVCAAQRVSNPAQVVINGSGFTPMPTSVLALPAVLMLPSVELTGVADLTGAEIATPEVALFSGDPEGERASRLTWQSRTQMTLSIAEPDVDVTDSLELAPGLYDVTLTNPDDKHSATLERGLAVVPPPSVSSVEPLPPVICSDQSDREITIRGANFLKLGSLLPSVTVALGATTETITPDTAEGCVEIPGTYAGVTAELCTTLNVTLTEDLLDPGAYQVTVTSPPPASCQSSEVATLVIVPPPFVDMLVPPAICIEQGAQDVTAEGGAFLKIGAALPTVNIAATGVDLDLVPTLSNCAMLEGTNASDAVEVCTSLTVTIEVGALVAGDYAFAVTNPDPAGCTSQETITLTVTSPPEVDSVAPASVCEGGSRLSITGSGFRDGSTVLLRCPAGRMIDARAVNVLSATQMEADIGAGIMVDEVCEVIVTNPEGCEDRPEPHQTVRGTAGPFLFFADPFVVYSGVDTVVTLFSTTIEAPLPSMPVTLVPTGASSPTESFDATIVVAHPNRAQFTIPSGHAAGVFDVILADDTGCSATLVGAVTIVDQTTIDIGSVQPPFGGTATRTAITVTRSGGMDFAATPRLFLNPTAGGSAAIAIESVTITDATTLTAVVPAGVPAGTYELVVINPDGAVGVLADAFRVLTDAPPVIRDVTPQSMVDNDTSADLTVTGSNFRNSEISLSCREASGTVRTLSVTSATETCVTADNCSQNATVDASVLSQGAVCVVRVTNNPGTDDSYGEFSAVGVTNSSLNLPDPVAGQTLTTARRAPVAAAVKATRVARFIYAIGGDGGSSLATTPFDSVESAFVDVFGNMRPFQADSEALLQARAFAGGTAVGRYLYVFGGNDGTAALNTAERALVLTPEETPTVQDVDLILGTAGLDAGQWSYRVSAVFANNDADNPGGESLASDTFIIRLPQVDTRKISVVLSWSRPLDALGVPLPNVASYRIYRTAVADETAGADEVLLAEVDASSTRFTDDGTATPMAGITPRPLGSTGTWHALPDLGAARMGPATALARDPADTDDSDGIDYVLYALMGKDGNTAHTSYEYLTITVEPNGRHTIGNAWTTGASSFTTGRWEMGAWTADGVVDAVLAPDTWIYVGGGRLGNGTITGAVDAGRITAGGELAIDSSVRDFNNDRSGYGVAAANGQLFAFGGAGGAASSDADAAIITGAPTLANNSWNSEGIGLSSARYLSGSAVQSAFIFLVGGASGTGATNTTELVIW